MTEPGRRSSPLVGAGALVGFLLLHRRAVVLAWIVSSLVLAVVATRLRVDTRLESLLPAEDRQVSEHMEAIRVLGATELVHVDVSAHEPAAAVRAAEVVASRMQESGLFRHVLGRADPETIGRTAEFLRVAAPLYLEAEDYAAIEARVRADALGERLESDVARLLEPGGTVGEKRLVRDPLDIGGLALRRALGAGAAGPPVTSDGRHVLVAAVARAPMDDEMAGERIASLLSEIGRDIAPAAQLDWVGGHRFFRANAAALRADIALVSVAGFLLVVAIVVLGYPGARSVLIAGAAGAMAALAGAAAAAAAFGEVSGIALAFGGALSGICVDCVLHLRAVPRTGETREESVRRTFAAVAPSVAIGALTSVAAFLVLLWSPVGVHRQIGVAGAGGIVGAAMFALLVGPVLAAGRSGAPHAPGRAARLEVVSGAMWKVVRARPRTWMIGSFAAVVCSAALLPRLEFEPDLRKFESKDAATLEAERNFAATWGGLTSRNLLVLRETDVEIALRRTEDLLAAFAPPGAEDPAQAWSSAVCAMPSRRTQDRRWTAWTHFWSDERRAALRRDLAAACGPLGIEATAFEPFIASLDKRPPPIDVPAVAATALGPVLQNHLLIDEKGGVRSVVSAPRDTIAPQGPGTRRADLAARGIHVLGGREFGDAVAEATRSALEVLALPAAAVVALLLAAYYRNARRSLAAMVPLLGGAAVAGAGLFLCGERLSLMTLPVVVPMFGFAVDYGVFTLDALDETESDPGRADAILAERGAGVLGAALTTASGGLAMLLATHPAVRSIGIALVWSVFSCVAIAWTAIPGLLRLRGPRP